MAITLDTIVNKVFKVVKNGYDNNEVEAFLDEILEEMENREAQTNQLREQVAELTRELEAAKAQLATAQNAPAAKAPATPVVADDRHATESFELVLSKAKGAYEEIVSVADKRADEIIAKANADAASIRSNAESQISDLTQKLASLRKQTSEYYASVKRAVDAQSASLDQIKTMR